MGLILYEMCSLFKTLMERVESLRNLRENQKVTEIIKEKFEVETRLILKMTKYDPAKRPSAEELLHSEEFNILRNEFENN